MQLDTLKNNRLILGILGVILLVIIIGTLVAAMTAQPPQVEKPPVAQTQPAPSPVTDAELQAVLDKDEQTADFANLVDDGLANQPIPTDSALIKDELVQLQDIDTQLNEQKTMLEQQHQDADELLKLKEAQLANLEKQLATQ